MNQLGSVFQRMVNGSLLASALMLACIGLAKAAEPEESGSVLQPNPAAGETGQHGVSDAGSVPALIEEMRQVVRRPKTAEDLYATTEASHADKIISALSKHGKAAVAPLTEVILKEADLRFHALAALARIGITAESAVPAVLSLATHADGETRAEAVETLGKIGARSPEAIGAIGNALTDRFQPVRAKATRALAGLGPAAKDALPTLMRAWQTEEDESVKQGILDAFGLIGPAALPAVPILVNALQNKKPIMRWGAARSLGRIGPAANQAIPALEKSLTDETDYVRKQVDEALKAIRRNHPSDAKLDRKDLEQTIIEEEEQSYANKSTRPIDSGNSPAEPGKPKPAPVVQAPEASAVFSAQALIGRIADEIKALSPKFPELADFSVPKPPSTRLDYRHPAVIESNGAPADAQNSCIIAMEAWDGWDGVKTGWAGMRGGPDIVSRDLQLSGGVHIMASIETPNAVLRQAIAAVIDNRTRPTKEDFQMIRQGMSRDEIHVLLGQPSGILAQGAKDVETEIWVTARDARGQRTRLTVLFWTDGKAHGIGQDVLETDRTSDAETPDAIDRLVARLEAIPGQLWINGASPSLQLPETASPEQVVEQIFKFTGFDRGHVKDFNILKVRSVPIGHGIYTAALTQTDLGPKIVLFTAGGAWSRVYDADEPEKSQGISAEAKAVFDDLNLKCGSPAWREEFDKIERPDARPANHLVSGEASALLANAKKRLGESGLTVKWNPEKKVYEVDEVVNVEANRNTSSVGPSNTFDGPTFAQPGPLNPLMPKPPAEQPDSGIRLYTDQEAEAFRAKLGALKYPITTQAACEALGIDLKRLTGESGTMKGMASGVTATSWVELSGNYSISFHSRISVQGEDGKWGQNEKGLLHQVSIYPRVEARSVRKKDDKVEVSIHDDTLFVDVLSPSGIGDARLALTSGAWPKKVVVRLKYAADKPFTRLEGPGATLEELEARHDQAAIHLNVRPFERKDGFEADLPIGVHQKGSKVLSLHWVDAYRN